ncbi:hypothetical protein [Frankia sp. AgB32]|uniref:hypothetical protein n=1 Tax=Frankia sp. AgB32 TaxID=631119 RepID=UPI00200EAA6B|nr:hypothetical protein [Frankia sp. AgB32]MCK9897499.1 hypothetical protein [Frankia sp. AgB32]
MIRLVLVLMPSVPPLWWGMAADLADLVRDWPVGAIAERRLDAVTIRRLAAFAKPTVEVRLDQ